ncbi:ly6/PLAUR domain-containing protein 1-like [Anneissia japonica]|uniref:ly6/PLAUR domain-containing protein 1-like n=1 Tax=Anneissia japonica TaxID=1529436 RepID=UPI0014259B90|nr:ly6/PLAUR domain-containing protein 1-like [Anneissia japonica]
MDIVSLLITFVSLFSLTGALQCYKCDDCKKNTDNTETCNILHQFANAQCGKFIVNGVVSRGCTNEATCTIGGVFVNECSPGNEDNCYKCCSTDLCNAATSSVISASVTSCFVIIATTMTMWLLK